MVITQIVLQMQSTSIVLQMDSTSTVLPMESTSIVLPMENTKGFFTFFTNGKYINCFTNGKRPRNPKLPVHEISQAFVSRIPIIRWISDPSKSDRPHRSVIRSTILSWHSFQYGSCYTIQQQGSNKVIKLPVLNVIIFSFGVDSSNEDTFIFFSNESFFRKGLTHLVKNTHKNHQKYSIGFWIKIRKWFDWKIIEPVGL